MKQSKFCLLSILSFSFINYSYSLKRYAQRRVLDNRQYLAAHNQTVLSVRTSQDHPTIFSPSLCPQNPCKARNVQQKHRPYQKNTRWNVCTLSSKQLHSNITNIKQRRSHWWRFTSNIDHPRLDQFLSNHSVFWSEPIQNMWNFTPG
jgi:hypothetical protein